MAMRFLHGSVGGMLVGVAFGVFARTRTPDRVFGMLLVVQYGLGGLGIMLLPRLVPVYGHGVLFGALITFSAVTLLMLPFLDAYPRGRIERVVECRPRAQGTAHGGRCPCSCSRPATWASPRTCWASRAHSGLDANFASTALGLATWIGIAGSALVVAFGTRFGRSRPLAISAAVHGPRHARLPLERVGRRLPRRQLHHRRSPGRSRSAYLLGMCAAFDHTGRAAALGGFLSKMGLALGPVRRRVAARRRRLRDADQGLGGRARRERARDAAARARSRRYCHAGDRRGRGVPTSVCGLRSP